MTVSILFCMQIFNVNLKHGLKCKPFHLILAPVQVPVAQAAAVLPERKTELHIDFF